MRRFPEAVRLPSASGFFPTPLSGAVNAPALVRLVLDFLKTHENADQFPAIRNVPIWMMVCKYDSAAYSEATPAACEAVKGFAVEGRDNARVTVYETIITPQGNTVHQHMVPTGVENNMIFNANIPTNYTIFEGGTQPGAMMANGHPGHATVGIPRGIAGIRGNFAVDAVEH